MSGDWDELGKPNLARMSLIEGYWMLQNVKMSEFQLLLFLSYFENNRRGGEGEGLG